MEPISQAIDFDKLPSGMPSDEPAPKRARRATAKPGDAPGPPALARLNHPGVMFSPARNGSAAKFSRARPWSETLAEDAGRLERRERHLPVFLQLCSVVAFAHDRGIVHNNLAPLAVRTSAFGEVYVTGWEESRAADPSGRGVQKDIRQLGAILYEVLAGEPPRFREGKTPEAPQAIVPPREASPKSYIPQDMERLCLRALSPKPGKHFASALALRDRASECAMGLSRKRHAQSLFDKSRDAAELTQLRDYGKLNDIESLASRALSFWPENAEIRRWRFRVRRRKVELAIERRDFALAGTVLDIMEGGDGEAFFIDALRHSMEAGIARKRSARRRRSLLVGTVFFGLLCVIGGLGWVSLSQTGALERASKAKAEALGDRDHALMVLAALSREVAPNLDPDTGLSPRETREWLDSAWRSVQRMASLDRGGETDRERYAEICRALAEGYRALGDEPKAADLEKRAETGKFACPPAHKRPPAPATPEASKTAKPVAKHSAKAPAKPAAPAKAPTQAPAAPPAATPPGA